MSGKETQGTALRMASVMLKTVRSISSIWLYETFVVVWLQLGWIFNSGKFKFLNWALKTPKSASSYLYRSRKGFVSLHKHTTEYARCLEMEKETKKMPWRRWSLARTDQSYYLATPALQQKEVGWKRSDETWTLRVTQSCPRCWDFCLLAINSSYFVFPTQHTLAASQRTVLSAFVQKKQGSPDNFLSSVKEIRFAAIENSSRHQTPNCPKSDTMDRTILRQIALCYNFFRCYLGHPLRRARSLHKIYVLNSGSKYQALCSRVRFM